MTAAERWRCFVAVRLTEPARSAVVEYVERLRATVAGVAWIRVENLHLTLQFLGAVEPSRVASLTERLRDALGDYGAFTLRVAGVGAFPNVAHPQVLWVGTTSDRVGGLAERVQGASEAEGFARERRAFHPHVTVGRVRTRSRRDAPDVTFLARDGAWEFGVVRVEQVVLYRSELRAGGALHTPLAIFPLAPG